MEKKIEDICFQLISNSGYARTCFIEAMNEANDCNFEASEGKMLEGTKYLKMSHDIHSSLFAESNSILNESICLLLAHSEDLVISAETIKIVAKQFIKLLKNINN